MTRLLLIALLSLGLLVAGCGGDDEGDSTAADATAQTQAETAPTGTSEDEGERTTEERADDKGGEQDEGSSDDSGAGDDGEGDSGRSERQSAQLRQAVAQCKRNVQQAPQLSKDAKKDLVELCEKAASGDPEELREVSREVCKRIITDTLPAGEQREQALKLCEQAGEQQQ